MEMTQLSPDYWNALASQLIVISSLLAGFSLSLIFSLAENKSKVMNYVFRASVTATASFLVSIFAMTKILMLTNKGFPFKIAAENLIFPRITGIIFFIIGILSIIVILALSGWVKSENSKNFTTTVGIITFILIVLMLT
jgi:hypothetical protein